MILPAQPSRVVNVFCHPHKGGCGVFTRVQFPPGVYDYSHTCPNCGDTSVIKVNLPLPGVALLPRQTVHAFGDESSFGSVIAYGVAAVEAPNRLAAERFLSGLKQRYGVNPKEELHCKELFHVDTRQETAWKHLTADQILDFAEELISGLVRLPMLFIVGAAHRSEQPEELPEAGHFPAFETGTKQLSALLCGAALLPLNQHYDQSEIKFWTDPDRTKISFSWGKVQAYRMHYLNNSDRNQRISAQPLDRRDKPSLLQVADLFAFTATHALTEKQHHHKKRFERLYKLCSPEHSFMGYHDEDEVEFKPIPSRLESRHAEVMAASSGL
jgi:hypothetical protein